MTKEESRATILNWLCVLMDSDKEDIAYANEFIAQYSDSEYEWRKDAIENRYKPLVKYGVYHQVSALRDTIIRAMGIAPEKIETHTRWISYSSHTWTSEKKVTTHTPIYSDETEAMVKTVIRRMEEQGYIKISKSGKGFKVCKV